MLNCTFSSFFFNKSPGTYSHYYFRCNKVTLRWTIKMRFDWVGGVPHETLLDFCRLLWKYLVFLIIIVVLIYYISNYCWRRNEGLKSWVGIGSWYTGMKRNWVYQFILIRSIYLMLKALSVDQCIKQCPSLFQII